MRGKSKFMKKMLLLLAAVMMLSSSMVVFASNGSVQLKTLTIMQTVNGTDKKVSKLTLYTNGKDAAVDGEEVGATSAIAESPTTVTLKVNAIRKNGESADDYILTSSNRQIATVRKGDNGTIVITAGTKSGKATITVTDKNNLKKKAKVTVTVNTLAEDINFDASNNVVGGEMTVAVKGKLALGAAVDGGATVKKLQYKVYQYEAWLDGGKLVEDKTIATVDSKGYVKGVKEGTAVVRVSATDQSYKNGKKTVKTGNYADVVVTVVARPTAKNTITLNGGNKINLVSNETSENNTYQLDATYSGDGDLTYISSKPSVATVDSDGMITAVANGSATISVMPADGNDKTTAKKVTVKVTTLPEIINVPNDEIVVLAGKKVKLGASFDKAVSNKKFEYGPVSDESVITVKSGTITAKKEGTATFVVRSQAKDKDGVPYVSRTIRVTVVNPVKSLTATVPAYNSKKNIWEDKKSTTLYVNRRIDGQSIEGEESLDKSYITVVPTFDSKKGGSREPGYSFTSSNYNVAWVSYDYDKDQFYIQANGKGKATITVTANDGSNKKAKITVTVVEKVQGINVNTVFVANDSSMKVQASAWNTNANNQKFEYEFVPDEGYADKVALKEKNHVSAKGITITAKGITDITNPVKVGTLKVTAQDATTFPVQSAVSETAEVWVQPGEVYITQEMLDRGVTGFDGYALKKGEKWNYAAQQLGWEIDQSVTKRALKWTSSKSSVVSVDKNGVLTAKKVSDEPVTITVTATDKGASASASFKVYVGQSQADFVKDMDEKLKFTVTSEDYNWVGMKPAFNTKTKAVNIDVTNMAFDRNSALSVKDEIENVLGIFTNAFIDPDFKEVTLQDYSEYDYSTGNYIIWRVYVDNKLNIVISRGYYYFDFENYVQKWAEVERIADLSIGDARSGKIAKTLASALTRDADSLLAWAGKSFWITLAKEVYVGGASFSLNYSNSYPVNFTTDKDTVNLLLDARAKAQIDAINDVNKVEETGISEIIYNADTNTATVKIADGSVKIEDAMNAIKNQVIESLMEIFKEAEVATLEIIGSPADEVRTIERKDGDMRAAIERQFDKLLKKLNDNNMFEMSMLEGITIRATATSKFNNAQVKADYYVVFVVDTDVTKADERVDKAIEDQLDEINDNDGIAEVSYNKDSNTLTVEILKGEQTIEELKNLGIMDVVNTILETSKAKSVKIGDTTFDDVEKITAAALLNAIDPEDQANKLSDLSGTYTVIVYLDGGKYLTYTITVAEKQVEDPIDKDEVDKAVDDAINEQTVEINKKGEGIASVEYEKESNTLQVNIQDAGKSIEELSSMGIMDVVNTILETSKAKSVEIENTAFTDVTKITATDLKNAINSEAKTLADLDGKEYKVVIYLDAAKTKQIEYTLSFTSVKPETETAPESIVEPEVTNDDADVVEEDVETVADDDEEIVSDEDAADVPSEDAVDVTDEDVQAVSDEDVSDVA